MADPTTDPTVHPDIAAEALRGPWQAVLLDSYGYVLSTDEFQEDGTDPDEVRIVIVRGTAAPVPDGGDTASLRMPGTYSGGDLLVEFEGSDFEGETEEEAMRSVLSRLVQAQAMAAGLNAAAQAVAR